MNLIKDDIFFKYSIPFVDNSPEQRYVQINDKQFYTYQRNM